MKFLYNYKGLDYCFYACMICSCFVMYGAQNETYMSRSAEKWVKGLCFNELGVGG